MKHEIGLFGFGTVGRGYYEISSKDNTGLAPSIIIVRDREKKRNYSLDFSYEPAEILDSDVSIGVELISNVNDAYHYVSQLLKAGKKVISANKKLLAAHLPEFIQLQREFGGTLLYEAAVAAGIPIIAVLETHFHGDTITGLEAILNGSSNYILTRLFEDNLTFKDALALAQAKGFAELDPAFDINGSDVASKLSILSLHAFGKFIKEEAIPTLGVQNIRIEDVKLAKALGLKIKLLATIIKKEEEYEVLILPAYVHSKDPLFQIENEYNGIKISSQNLSEQFYKGKGAGSYPTGASVYADLNKLVRGFRYSYPKMTEEELEIKVPKPFCFDAIIRCKDLDGLYSLLGEEINCFKYEDHYWLVTSIETSTLLEERTIIDQYEISIIALNNNAKPIDIMDIMIQKQNVIDIERYIR